MRLRRITLKPAFIARHPCLTREEWDYFAMHLDPMPVGVVIQPPYLLLSYADDLRPEGAGVVTIRSERTMH